MKLNHVIFYKIRSRQWASVWSEHASIELESGEVLLASLFYADKLFAGYGLALGYTHELMIRSLSNEDFTRMYEENDIDVVAALAKKSYFLEPE